MEIQLHLIFEGIQFHDELNRCNRNCPILERHVNRPYRNFEKWKRESAAHSDSLGNSRKSRESPPCSSAAFPPNLSCFRFICALQEPHNSYFDRCVFSLDYLAISSFFTFW